MIQSLIPRKLHILLKHQAVPGANLALLEKVILAVVLRLQVVLCVKQCYEYCKTQFEEILIKNSSVC